jgi:hypothetical protein
MRSTLSRWSVILMEATTGATRCTYFGFGRFLLIGRQKTAGWSVGLGLIGTTLRQLLHRQAEHSVNLRNGPVPRGKNTSEKSARCSVIGEIHRRTKNVNRERWFNTVFYETIRLDYCCDPSGVGFTLTTNRGCRCARSPANLCDPGRGRRRAARAEFGLTAGNTLKALCSAAQGCPRNEGYPGWNAAIRNEP